MGIYRHWLETPEVTAKFKAKYGIPDDVRIRLNDPEIPFDGYDFTNGWMPFYLVTIIEGGVQFPLHPLLISCLKKWHLTPGQLMPNIYKIIMGVAKLNKILSINLNVHDIEDVYDLSKSSGDGFYHLRVKAKRQCFINNLEDSNKKHTTSHSACVTALRMGSEGCGCIANDKPHNSANRTKPRIEIPVGVFFSFITLLSVTRKGAHSSWAWAWAWAWACLRQYSASICKSVG
ncbi:hypothetical protein CKAN_01243400 [Cinnamomum micranthum f. kanehirae]|uniref:Uncharacterized protein n=1 Tax=Cinnamomum micranthum f. kanehirae TaxID=337451 RepID=A0A3S4NZC5_9MAGN|nr:hypothetical protein CKAN_01243400 [Cinnamomum micranthum f. kanehirae]